MNQLWMLCLKKIKKKEQRLAPTFVNLKSNTMKNTMQRYGYFGNLQDILFIL